jgi:hypothetical protein
VIQATTPTEGGNKIELFAIPAVARNKIAPALNNSKPDDKVTRPISRFWIMEGTHPIEYG